jgi:hypothetical protein
LTLSIPSGNIPLRIKFNKNLVDVMASDTHNVTGSNGKEYSYPKDRYRDPNRKDLRRNPDGKRKGYQIAEMWDQHHEIARRLVLGESNKDIAESLGVSACSVSNVKNSPVVQDKLSILRAARDAGTIDLAREIQDLAPIALQRLKEVLETGTVLGKEASAAVILKEANAIMDREMGKAVQRVDTRNSHMHFGPEDLERIKNRAMELAPSLGGL